MKRGDSIKDVKMFAWVMGGVLRITVGKEVNKVSKGMVFGSREILAGGTAPPGTNLRLRKHP